MHTPPNTPDSNLSDSKNTWAIIFQHTVPNRSQYIAFTPATIWNSQNQQWLCIVMRFLLLNYSKWCISLIKMLVHWIEVYHGVEWISMHCLNCVCESKLISAWFWQFNSPKIQFTFAQQYYGRVAYTHTVNAYVNVSSCVKLIPIITAFVWYDIWTHCI